SYQGSSPTSERVRISCNPPVHVQPSASSHANCTTPRRFPAQFSDAARSTLVQLLLGTYWKLQRLGGSKLGQEGMSWRQPPCRQQQPPPSASTSTAAKFMQ
ncbi:hypothetical protein Taro_001845, partial [Colocasia esculenta]|nr:hypothetical protein [Colocasia esculenta]